MDMPFYWNMPSRPRYYSPVATRETPVQRQKPTMAARGVPVQRQSTTAPKVVSIPVQFVGSERSKADSAVKIQKVFRGFLVRKGVKKVLALRKEVDEIEKRIRDEEVVELIRRPESKERVKLIEALMNLLFRLDSVRGVVPEVRDCRKAAIKKAIALQEAIDAIVAGKAVGIGGGDSEKRVDEDPTLQLKDGAPEVKDSDPNNSILSDEAVGGASIVDENCTDEDPTIDMKDESPEVKDLASNDISGNCNSSDDTVTTELQHNIDQAMLEAGEVEEAEATSPPNPNSNESGDGAIQEPTEENQGKLELSTEGEIAENPNPSLMDESLKESVCTSPSEIQTDSAPKIEENAMETNQQSEEKKDRDVLQRMVEDNERMMSLMEELVEKNDKQTRLLNSLSQRVEMLERAFLCDKLRRSKKKRHT